MNILIFSPSFLPVLGGLENMMHYLATGLSNLGANITVVTLEKATALNEEYFNYKVVRRPSVLKFYKIYKHCDVYLNFNVSLKGLWPLLIKRKPYFISHQITYINLDGNIDFLEQVKRFISRFTINISCSDFVRQTLPLKNGYVIGNCYNDSLFKELSITRDLDIAYVGRLVSDKGIDTLLNSLSYLKVRDLLYLKLTIIGSGPELDHLKELVKKLDLGEQVYFAGVHKEEKLTALLNRHHMLIVPSKWKEPFGIVALEGLACGCKLVVSKEGGLVEAAGDEAITFENGNAESLYKALKICYLQYDSSLNYSLIEAHLKKHTIMSVAQEYLTFIKTELANS